MRRFLITTFLITSLLISGCSERQPYRRIQFYMGTTVEFNIPTRDTSRSAIKKACDLAEKRISSLDAILSIFNGSSAVSEINNDRKKKTVAVRPELFLLTKMAHEYFVLTQGAFDITVGPLTEIWGFGPGKAEVPDAGKIKDTMDYVGFDNIELDDKNSTLTFLDPRIRLDFGGFAKGYAAGEAARILKENGITDGLVNIGGDLYCMGTNQWEEKWAIGVRDPDDKSANLAIIEVTDKAIATSGNYENFYIYNDRLYSHIIDPRLGVSVSNNIESATVIADDCAAADALATAIFVMGEREGLDLIEKLSDIECLLVVSTANGRKIRMSSGMERFLKK